MTPLARTLLVAALILAAFIGGVLLGGTLSTGPSLVSAGGEKANAAGAATSAEAAKGGTSTKRETMADAAEKRRLPWDKERLAHTTAALVRESGIANFFRHSMQFMDQLSATDFPLALEANADSEKRGDFGDMLAGIAITRWAELDAKAAADYLLAHEKFGGFIDIAGVALWNTWAANDPDAALAYAKTMTDKDRKESALKKIIETIAQADPAKALAYAKLHTPEMLGKGELSIALSRSSSGGDSEAIARSLAKIEADDSDTRDIMGSTMRNWATTDHAAALAFAQGLATPTARAVALAGVYNAWFERDPKEAAASFLAEPRGEADFDSVLLVAASRWTLSDWQGANAWSAQLPTEKERTAFVTNFSMRLGRENPDESVKWIAALPDGLPRDTAIVATIEGSRTSASQASMDLALSIANPSARQKTTRQAMQNWFYKDPAAAYDWLQNDPTLTPEQKRALLAK